MPAPERTPQPGNGSHMPRRRYLPPSRTPTRWSQRRWRRQNRQRQEAPRLPSTCPHTPAWAQAAHPDRTASQGSAACNCRRWARRRSQQTPKVSAEGRPLHTKPTSGTQPGSRIGEVSSGPPRGSHPAKVSHATPSRDPARITVRLSSIFPDFATRCSGAVEIFWRLYAEVVLTGLGRCSASGLALQTNWTRVNSHANARPRPGNPTQRRSCPSPSPGT